MRIGKPLLFMMSLLGTAALLTSNVAGAPLTRVRPALEETSEPNAGIVFQTIHSFKSKSDGVDPWGNLVDIDGVLYGTTLEGGVSSNNCLNGTCGTVFAVNSRGEERIVYTFKSRDDGSTPGGLIDVDGVLYGTTLVDSASGNGTLYSLTVAGKEKIIHWFAGTDGSTPSSRLEDIGGNFYGLALTGGLHGSGTLFRVTPAGRSTVVYNFRGGTIDGFQPRGDLVYVNGSFIGSARGGGEHQLPRGARPRAADERTHLFRRKSLRLQLWR